MRFTSCKQHFFEAHAPCQSQRLPWTQESVRERSSEADAPFCLHCCTENAYTAGNLVLVPAHVFVPRTHEAFLRALWEAHKLPWPCSLGLAPEVLEVHIQVGTNFTIVFV